MIARNPGLFVVRARETSIFVPENPRRLGYYDPSWSTAKLVAVQLEHAVGILNRYPDGNYFWPTGRPILPPALAALTLLGLGASLLKVRDVRFLLLSAWFWLGFVGVIVTVETPNLHRMSTAVPVLALFAGLVLDDAARRISELAARARPPLASGLLGGIGAVAGLVVLALAGRELVFYFRDYARTDAWPSPRAEGQGVSALGPGAWALSVGREFHMVGSGWIYLYAPDVLRGGILAPGSSLPVPLVANRDVGFVVYARQPFYLPLLREIYPGGETIRVTHAPDIHVYDVYRVPRPAWAARQGALAERPGAAPVRVPTLGAPPPGAASGPMRWAATLRSPRFWNYGFRVGPGPARLSIDGRPILDLPRGRKADAVAVHLAQGDHHLVLEGEVDRDGSAPALRWAMADESGALGDAPAWEAVPTPRLVPEASPPGGLFCRLVHEGRPEIRRRDRAIATGGIGDEIPWAPPFRAVWSGRLHVPEPGTYRMTFDAQGEVELVLDGRVVVRKAAGGGERASGDVPLAARTYELEIRYDAGSSPGFIEWRWRPPSGVDSIVPPSALSPPPGAGVGPPEPIAVIGPGPLQPREKPVVLRW